MEFESTWAATNFTSNCYVVPAPRMEDAAIAMLWTLNPLTARNPAEVLVNLLEDHGIGRGGRRLASRAALPAGLRALLGRAAAPPDSRDDWGRAAREGLILAHRAMKTLMQTVTGDGEVLELAAAVEALSSAVVASRVLRAEHCFSSAPAPAIEALESAFVTVGSAAKRALGCQWLQKQQQQQQHGQQQQQQQAAVTQSMYRGTRRAACAFCGAARADGASLRGCRGCSSYTAVRYCSQACCEAHWAKRHHRRLCEMVQAHRTLTQSYCLTGLIE
jgi:hypothetical protein